MIEVKQSSVVKVPPESVMKSLARPKLLFKGNDMAWVEREDGPDGTLGRRIGAVYRDRTFEGNVLRTEISDAGMTYVGGNESYTATVVFKVFAFGNGGSRVEANAQVEGQDWKSRMALRTLSLARGRIDQGVSKIMQRLVKRLEQIAAK